MRIESLLISNFRAIQSFEINDLGDVVVIAGPNGCGKSAVFHALRLLKSLHGSYYRDNEYQQWFREFEISLDSLSGNQSRLFRDPGKGLTISAEFSLSAREVTYLIEHGRKPIEARVWIEIAPQAVNWGRDRPVVTPDMLRKQQQVKEETENRYERLRKILESQSRFKVAANVTPNGEIVPSGSPVMELIFSTYDPSNIGVIEYHADTRQYGPASMGNLNVNFSDLAQRRMQQALYNINAKYQNLRSDLLANYLTRLVRQDAGEEIDGQLDLLDSLKELFRNFFPGKEFVGAVARPDGSVDFPVELDDGSRHDIADLSAGEKEIVFGYLRLQGLNPKDSILLFDEPELHLNPRLITGLLDFYSRHLGATQGNQLWLTTHSDTLLYEAIGKPKHSVFHLRSMTSREANQAVEITGDDELNRAIIEIVGDLAAFQPGRPLVILEGGGENPFDAVMVRRLFPRIAAAVNLVSVGNKRSVQQLFDALRDLRKSGSIPFKVWGIVDKDVDDPVEPQAGADVLMWDRYHIENYLLEDHYVFEAVKAVGTFQLSTEHEVSDALLDAASDCLTETVNREIRSFARRRVKACVSLGNPKNSDVIDEITSALTRSVENIRAAADELGAEALRKTRDEIHSRLSADIRSEAWRTTFRGRDVLNRFVSRFAKKTSYLVLRNLILDKMANARFEPKGMAETFRRMGVAEDESNAHMDHRDTDASRRRRPPSES